LPEAFEDGDNALSPVARETPALLGEELQELDHQRTEDQRLTWVLQSPIN